MEIDVNKLITLDFETYWDSEFSLSKLPTGVYVRDPKFSIHCVGIKIGAAPTKVVFYDDVPAVLRGIDWSDKVLLCHNTAFDGFILSDRFDIRPAFYLDTLSMARAVLGSGVRHSLDHLSVRFNLPQKLSVVLESTRGVVRYSDTMIEAVQQYCARDVDNTFFVFLKLLPNFPAAELELIDTTLRMYCRPLLQVNRTLVQEELDYQTTTKLDLLARSGVTREVLLSNDKFAALLESKGVDPPTKISPRTGKPTWAFAKSDPDFLALMEETWDEDIRQLVEARLIVKSTIGETRAARLLKVSESDMPIPVMLKYCGAHTTRWSAGDRMNFQNFPRDGRLRKSLYAPKGHVLVVCDSAQIEARVNAWLAGQTDVLDKFRAGEDVYKYMAARIFNIDVAEVTKTQRFLGKVCVLALGYGMGADKFRRTLKIAKPSPMDISESEAQEITNNYRSASPQIKQQWQDLEVCAQDMTRKTVVPRVWKCLEFSHEKVRLPNGLFMVYDDIGYDDEGQLGYRTLKGWVKLYGGLITENIVQGLARTIVAEQMTMVARRYPIVLMTHDEMVACVRKEEAEEALAFTLQCMRTPPAWGPDIPVNAEGGFDEIYSK